MGLFYKPRSRSGEPLPPLQERLLALGSIPPFLGMVFRTRPVYALGIIVCRVANAFTPLALLWVGKLIVDEVVANIGATSPAWERLLELVLLELCIAIVADLLLRLSGLLESLLTELFTNDLSVRLMRHAAMLDLTHFEDPGFFDKLQRARRQTSGQVLLLSHVLLTAQQALTLLSLLAALVAFNGWLLLILVLALVPSFVGETAYAGIAYSFQFGWSQQRRELEYLKWVTSEPMPAKEIKLFGLADYFIEKFTSIADRYVEENRRIATHRAATGAVLTGLSTLAHYGAIAFILHQTVVGLITLGTMTFLAGSFERSRSLMNGILMRLARMYEQALHLQDLFDFLAVRPSIVVSENPRPVPNAIREGFKFQSVGYRYPGADSWAVRQISFRIRPGERIALVGENGAGKTTLVKLLTRLYDPVEGRILLEGVDLRDYDLEALRRAVGVIFQDFFRYDLTAAENIAVGNIDARHNHDLIKRAAEKSLAAETVSSLKNGYEQLLGRRFRDGVDLSGGQWQKLALARAYMGEAKLLILDEPTAALDARSEFAVFERFSELTEGRMAVLISHRFSTVRMAERILVLDGGRVVEEGTHEALLARGGNYAALFTLQAAGYR